MEGARLDARGAEAVQTAPHLARGTRGERDRQHLGGDIEALRHSVGDPVRDRARLAGARPGEDADRPAECLGDLTLLGVEGAQQVSGPVGQV